MTRQFNCSPLRMLKLQPYHTIMSQVLIISKLAKKFYNIQKEKKKTKYM